MKSFLFSCTSEHYVRTFMYINLIILSGLFEGVSLQHVGLYILKQYTHTILI